jgi:catechol 2,3-dioxygenase-like lactoylglutathione lyase family enzyme
MAQLELHHVSLIVTDLPRSLAFYQNLSGLTIIERPSFKNAGAWLACGTLQGAFDPPSTGLLQDQQHRQR